MGIGFEIEMHWASKVVHRLKKGCQVSMTIGLAATLKLIRIVVAGATIDQRGAAVMIKPKPLIHPVGIRPGTSDLDVFRQIFCHPEYACLDQLKDVRLIIDCGANVGYSSAYFLSRFPGARVIAVEADYSNYLAARDNLAPYGDRVTLLHAGVWSKEVPLRIRQEVYRDGREWAFQVEELSQPAEGALQGIDLPALIRLGDCDEVSLLKIDIEGAEAEVFAKNAGCEKWLPVVRNIAIELHDDTVFGDCRTIFHRAIGDQRFTISTSGELTICQRL